MPGTTSTALPSFSHDQHHDTDASFKAVSYEDSNVKHLKHCQHVQ